MLDALSEGVFMEQYGAVLALRSIGAEAWAEGYGEDLVYRVRLRDSEWQTVKPAVRDR